MQDADSLFENEECRLRPSLLLGITLNNGWIVRKDFLLLEPFRVVEALERMDKVNSWVASMKPMGRGFPKTTWSRSGKPALMVRKAASIKEASSMRE